MIACGQTSGDGLTLPMSLDCVNCSFEDTTHSGKDNFSDGRVNYQTYLKQFASSQDRIYTISDREPDSQMSIHIRMKALLCPTGSEDTVSFCKESQALLGLSLCLLPSPGLVLDHECTAVHHSRYKISEILVVPDCQVYADVQIYPFCK